MKFCEYLDSQIKGIRSRRPCGGVWEGDIPALHGDRESLLAELENLKGLNKSERMRYMRGAVAVKA